MNDSDHRVRIALARAGFMLDVDLRLPGSGITALFGPSGSGKTTLLRCVAGLERTGKGLIRIAGQTWQDDATKRFTPAWRRPLGYVFQESNLFAHLSVEGNLAYGARRSGHPPMDPAMRSLVTMLGIDSLLGRDVETLSGGERQRVAIARALATRPRLLLLDEPLASIDAARRNEILPWLQRLRDEAGIPMVYVTHSVDEVARLADTLVLLEHGRVRDCGAVIEVLARRDGAPAPGEDPGALIEARIVEHDRIWHLARAEFAGGSLWIRDPGHRAESRIRLRVLARDVSLARVEPQQSTIQNHFVCRIISIDDDGHPSQALVRIQCGQTRLLARVTRRAIDMLGLVAGQQVWAQLKSVAVID